VVRCMAIVTSEDSQHPISTIKNRECMSLHQKHNSEKSVYVRMSRGCLVENGAVEFNLIDGLCDKSEEARIVSREAVYVLTPIRMP